MKLTKTEYKVAKLVTLGLTEKEIATKLFVSPFTIHNHTKSIRTKLEAKTKVDIARIFILKLDDPKLLLVGQSSDFKSNRVSRFNKTQVNKLKSL